MEHPIEGQIWQLVLAFGKLKGDRQVMAMIDAVIGNLREITATELFCLLTTQPLALLQVIRNDPRTKEPDRCVAVVLLKAFDPALNYCSLSYPQISIRTGLTTNQVRGALKRLLSAGYFTTIAPTTREQYEGESSMKYQPQFGCLAQTE